MQLLNLRELFALHNHGVLKTFRNVAGKVLQRHVVLQYAALHLEIVDASGEGIRERLEHKQREWLGVVVFALDAIALAAGFLMAHHGVLVGMREYICQEGQQAGAAHVARGRNHQHRNNLFRDDGATNRGNQILNRNGALAEKFLHHLVVALGDHLDEFFVRFLCFVHQRIRNVVDRGFAISIRRV